MNKILKIVIFSVLSLATFCGSIFCGLYSGVYLKKESSEGIKYLIDKECEKQDCGNAIFASVSFDYSEDNLKKIDNSKQNFNEVLNNQLSLAEYNCTIDISGSTFSEISIMETEYYSESYDSMHIYSHYSWYYFNEDINNVYVSSTFENKIKSELKVKDIKGLEITIKVNGAEKVLSIGGAYYSNFYPSITGLGARGDGVVASFGEMIFVHPEVITEFKPSKGIAMFSSGSSNNGRKYIDLKKETNLNGFEFEFYKQPLADSTLVDDIKIIENYFSSGKRIFASIALVFGALSLTVSFVFVFSILIKTIDLKSLGIIKETIFTFGLILSPLLISFITLFVFKKKTFFVSEVVKIPFLSTISIIFILISTLVPVLYLAIKQKHIIRKLFAEKEGNSEFDY